MIKTFKHQIKSLGISFDWSREINTSDPEYYKWTQWQFLQFYKAGMAYKAEKKLIGVLNVRLAYLMKMLQVVFVKDVVF